MARATTKQDLLEFSEGNFAKLQNQMSSMTEKELATPFDFYGDEKKKEAHWSRDRNLRDILIHLFEWHQLLLGWVRSNTAGNTKPFLPEPYNWKTYGDMNVEFWRKHQNTPLDEAKVMVEQSYQDVMELAESFSDEELFTKGIFPWVGGSTLGSYFVSATASHYDWAIKKLKAHKKNLKERSS